jgi:hypothetical protein
LAPAPAARVEMLIDFLLAVRTITAVLDANCD